MVVVRHSGTIGVAAVVVEPRDVLSGIASGGAASSSAFYITSRRTPSQTNLAEDIVIRRPARGRRVAVIHGGQVVHPAGLPNVLCKAVLRGVGFRPI